MARSTSSPLHPRRVVVVSDEVVVVDRPRRGVDRREKSFNVLGRMHVREDVEIVWRSIGNKGRQWLGGRVTALSTINSMRP